MHGSPLRTTEVMWLDAPLAVWDSREWVNYVCKKDLTAGSGGFLCGGGTVHGSPLRTREVMWLDAPLAVWDCHERVRSLPLCGVVGCAAGRFGIPTKRSAAYRSEFTSLFRIFKRIAEHRHLSLGFKVHYESKILNYFCVI